MADVYYAKLVSGIDSPITADTWIRRNFLNIKLALQNAVSPADFRTNLELGDISTQNANNVSITGGSIRGVPATTRRLSLSGNLVLAWNTDAQYQFLNPNGSDRVVTLWAASTSGEFVFIRNNGTANTLEIKDASAVSQDILIPGERAMYHWDGAEWQRTIG